MHEKRERERARQHGSSVDLLKFSSQCEFYPMERKRREKDRVPMLARSAYQYVRAEMLGHIFISCLLPSTRLVFSSPFHMSSSITFFFLFSWYQSWYLSQCYAEGIMKYRALHHRKYLKGKKPLVFGDQNFCSDHSLIG